MGMKLVRICTKRNLERNGIDKQTLENVGLRVPIIVSRRKFERFKEVCEAIENPLLRPKAFSSSKAPLHIDGVKIDWGENYELRTKTILFLHTGREHLMKAMMDAALLEHLGECAGNQTKQELETRFKTEYLLASLQFRRALENCRGHSFLEQLEVEIRRNMEALGKLREGVKGHFTKKD
ncbi:MAG: hypothetical protein N3E51_00940 [Candidatus Micrarchaeota archaeon]|nr:hypothetical protein [Candidatus Micrarchaeota archaeon]